MKYHYLTTVALVFAAFAFTSCEQRSDAEKAADEIGDAIEEIGDEIGDAARELE